MVEARAVTLGHREIMSSLAKWMANHPQRGVVICMLYNCLEWYK